MLYGATGYTGRLALTAAIERGERPIVAGRNPKSVGELAKRFDLEHRVLDLADSSGLRRGLIDVAAVLHCAGPFAWTSAAMVEACLATGTHYLDITGEIDVFEAIHALDASAQAAHSVLIPGVGFDVVPTDCLAARLAAELPDPARLDLAFHADGGSVSRGTMKSMVERMPKAGAVRRGGRIVPVPLAWDQREIEFGCGRRWAMTIPWGDVSTAFHSTGIGDVQVYAGASPAAIERARRLRALAPVVGLKPVKRLAQWLIGKRVTGPDKATRDKARTYLWGRVENARGRGVTATFDTPEGYGFTAMAAVDAALRVARGDVAPGAKTPSIAFGAGYVESLPGVSKIVVDHDG